MPLTPQERREANEVVDLVIVLGILVLLFWLLHEIGWAI